MIWDFPSQLLYLAGIPRQFQGLWHHNALCIMYTYLYITVCKWHHNCPIPYKRERHSSSLIHNLTRQLTTNNYVCTLVLLLYYNQLCLIMNNYVELQHKTLLNLLASHEPWLQWNSYNRHLWHTQTHTHTHTHIYIYIYIYICMHTECNFWQYVWVKEYVSGHRHKRTNIAAKRKYFWLSLPAHLTHTTRLAANQISKHNSTPILHASNFDWYIALDWMARCSGYNKHTM